MPTNDGDRPGGAPPPPTNPSDGPPKLRAVDDPADLSWAGRVLRNALARNGLTLANLHAPPEHVKAA